MTEYTDDQVNEAIMLANQTGKVYAWETEMYRNVIKHLPKPQDDWQDVTDILQIRRGDMLKNETENAVITYKYAVKRVNLSGCIIHFDNDEVLFWDDNHTFYRIPAPVQHPDPERHPAIHVEECDIINFIPKIMVWYRDSYVAGQQHLPPERITGWQQIDPAKVVADND